MGEGVVLEELRKGLTASYQHRPVEGASCIACGRSAVPLALHVVEFYHADSAKTPSTFVLTSQSRGTTRGSVPLCNVCCPPCGNCQLPIATPWIKKLVTVLEAQHSGITFVVGNGYCRHVHVLEDIRSLFRPVKLASARNSESPSETEMSTAIDLLVGEYLATHPKYEFPPSGDRHSSVLAIGLQIKPWLMDRLGGPLPYWRAMLESAKVWFPPGRESREFRVFCALFEADSNTFWDGHLELEALAREYNVWRSHVRGL